MNISIKIINSLKDRKGFDDWWHRIDEESKIEILDEIDVIINKELKKIEINK